MTKIKMLGSVMIVFMVLLQGIYAVYAYVDPSAFSQFRGTELFSASDSDWIVIYASRTAFVALIIGILLLRKEYQLLMWASLFGTVMPITDAWLAYQAGADSVVVYKHVGTVIYLLLTFAVLKFILIRDKNA